MTMKENGAISSRIVSEINPKFSFSSANLASLKKKEKELNSAYE